MKRELMNLCLVGRQTAVEGSLDRHIAEPDEALAGLMTAVLWQAVKDYLWMLAHGMIAERDAFSLSAAGEGFGTVVAKNGTVCRTNGVKCGGGVAGGATSMRELLAHLRGRDFGMLCECTRFHAVCVRERLAALHARWRGHKEEVRAWIEERCKVMSER